MNRIVRYEDGLAINVGDRVRIERDETRYPERGTWPRYRGREGTVVSINRTDVEVGLTWNLTVPDPVRTPSDSWFHPHELTLL